MWRIFVGRGFSRDINAEKTERLQPLKFRIAFAFQFMNGRINRYYAFAYVFLNQSQVRFNPSSNNTRGS